MKLNIQLFGGRGASSSGVTSRNMLQTKLYSINANENTRVIMKNSEGGVLFNAKMSQINNSKYSDDLRREASRVTYSKKDNTITITLKKEGKIEDLPF